ncbi:MAG: DUF1343 domain-containing protein [Pirellulaceae bacterium]
MHTVHFQTGLDSLCQLPPAELRDARLGLVMNQASVDASLEYACDAIERSLPGRLTTLFSPQHGMWGEQQANMIASGHATHARLGIPIYSLYSETRRPSPRMLDNIDCLVIDLQDVGTRVYTYIWTMLECLYACADAGKSVYVLDRPNPLGGRQVEGPVLQPDFISFVGNACIPLRHGLTIAELAQFFTDTFAIAVDLHIVKMQGWHRGMWFEECQRPWIWPSPNMPTLVTTVVYPGQVLLEGTQVSEGRGTTRPFEVVGAPYLDPRSLCAELRHISQPGLALLPLHFSPTFDKWAGHSCGGINLIVEAPSQVRSVRTTIAIMAAIARLAPDHFQWLPPPYEYEYNKLPIDILYGSPALRNYVEQVRGGLAICEDDLDGLAETNEIEWQAAARPHAIYDT